MHKHTRVLRSIKRCKIQHTEHCLCWHLLTLETVFQQAFDAKNCFEQCPRNAFQAASFPQSKKAMEIGNASIWSVWESCYCSCHILSGPDSVRVLRWRWNERCTRHLAKVFGEPPKWYLRPGQQGALTPRCRLNMVEWCWLEWCWLSNLRNFIGKKHGNAARFFWFFFEHVHFVTSTDSAWQLRHGTHSVVSLIQHCPGILPAKTVQEHVISGYFWIMGGAWRNLQSQLCLDSVIPTCMRSSICLTICGRSKRFLAGRRAKPWRWAWYRWIFPTFSNIQAIAILLAHTSQNFCQDLLRMALISNMSYHVLPCLTSRIPLVFQVLNTRSETGWSQERLCITWSRICRNIQELCIAL